MHLMDQGIIRITFKIGIFREGPRTGEIHDHGTSFEIQEQDFTQLFTKINL